MKLNRIAVGTRAFDLSVEDDEEEDELVAQILDLSAEAEILPSVLVSDESWVKYVVSLFDLEKLSVASDIKGVTESTSSGDSSRLKSVLTGL